jgi:serine/threonine-protein kinase RsbW
MSAIQNEASVGLSSGPLVAPVLGRVVGMLTARADCPIDRLDDALLVADAISAKAGSFSEDGRVNVRVVARAGSVELEVGPLRRGGAEELIASAALPGVGNVLERVADVLDPQQREGADFLVIRLGFDAHGSATSDRMELDDVT